MNPEQQNRRLALATFITNFGDFLSLFASIVFLYRSTNSALVAAYTVPIKSLAIAIAALLFPQLLKRFQERSLLIWTQVCSGLSILVLAILVLKNLNVVPWLVLSIVGIQAGLKQFFDSSRETASHGLGSATKHQRFFVSSLLRGQYLAQTLGPLSALLLVKYLPPSAPFFIDSLTFLVAGFLCINLEIKAPLRSNLSALKPLRYLKSSPQLLVLEFNRAILFWVATGATNLLLFQVFTDRLGTGIELSALYYSLIGLGSWLAGRYLQRPKGIATNDAEWNICGISLIALGVVRIVFPHSSALWFGVILILLGGVLGGSNAISSQTLRRHLCNNNSLPETISLETLVAKFVDWGSATVVAFFLSTKILTLNAAFAISGAVLILSGVIHLWQSRRTGSTAPESLVQSGNPAVGGR